MEQNVYTKQQLMDMGFGFDLNGNIETPDEAYERAVKYHEYRKKRLIDKACEWMKQNMYVEYIFEHDEDEKPIQYVCASASDSVDEFVNNFRKAMEK